MSALSYRMEVRFSPEVARPGERVDVEVRLADVQGEVSAVHAVVPQGGIFETLRPQGDGVYAVTSTVPWEAAPGTYSVYFYATDAQGNRGPDVWTQVMVAS